jgi:hypothetical protein
VIVRSWACLNRHCVNVFDMADADFPPCPRCGGLRVKWVPRPIAIKSEKTKQIDRTVTQLTETYGDKNYRSPRKHEATAPKVNPTVTPGKSMTFSPAGMPGWKTEVPLDAKGAPAAICAPTGVTASLTVKGLEKKVPVDKRSPTSHGSRPKYEASWRPPGGVPK